MSAACSSAPTSPQSSTPTLPFLPLSKSLPHPLVLMLLISYDNSLFFPRFSFFFFSPKSYTPPPFPPPRPTSLFLLFLVLENEFRGELVNQRWTRGERTSSRCQASQRLQSRRPIMVSDKALQPLPPHIPPHHSPHPHTLSNLILLPGHFPNP